jgi:hypothetical protein
MHKPLRMRQGKYDYYNRELSIDSLVTTDHVL